MFGLRFILNERLRCQNKTDMKIPWLKFLNTLLHLRILQTNSISIQAVNICIGPNLSTWDMWNFRYRLKVHAVIIFCTLAAKPLFSVYVYNFCLRSNIRNSIMKSSPQQQRFNNPEPLIRKWVYGYTEGPCQTLMQIGQRPKSFVS